MGTTDIIIERLPVASLTPYARNSRTHSGEQVKQIARSIKEFGFTNPVLIDAEDGIIAGHGRVMAAELLKLAEVPCIRLGYLTEAQKRAYIIADNKLAENAGWNDEMLAEELRAIADIDLDFDFSLIGFSDQELQKMLEGLSWGVDVIDRDGEDKAGASPWDRVGDAAEGVMFAFGAIQKRIDTDTYNRFVSVVNVGNLEEVINEMCNH